MKTYLADLLAGGLLKILLLKLKNKNFLLLTQCLKSTKAGLHAVMKSLLLLTCLFLLSPSVVLSEAVKSDDLVKFGELYYKNKFTNIPFSGKVIGQSQG